MIGDAGITPEDTEAQLELLAAAGVYDFFDLSIGAPHSGHLTISPMNVPEGYAAVRSPRQARRRRPCRRLRRRAHRRPAHGGTGRRGRGDGRGRDDTGSSRRSPPDPQGADGPGLGNDTLCRGERLCRARARGVEVACVVNPATGREGRWGEGTVAPAAIPRRVAVLGAGPAGLRAGATAAARGHAVVIHERRGEPGGHLRDFAWLPTRAGWLRAVDDLVAAVERGGGELRLGSEPGVDELVEARPDVVLLATGAGWDAAGRSARRPDRDGIPGADGGETVDIGAALARARADLRSLGRRVLILDEAGTYLPLGLAEALAAAGVEVEIATPAATIGWSAAVQLELPHVLPRLGRLGVILTAWHDIAGIDVGTVVLRDVWSERELVREGIDTVVLALERRPRDELLDPLREALADVRLIGDARAPRSTAAVIHEAEEVGRAL